MPRDGLPDRVHCPHHRDGVIKWVELVLEAPGQHCPTHRPKHRDVPGAFQLDREAFYTVTDQLVRRWIEERWADDDLSVGASDAGHWREPANHGNRDLGEATSGIVQVDSTGELETFR